MDSINKQLIEIAAQVAKEIKRGYYTNKRGEEIEFEHVNRMLQGSMMWNDLKPFDLGNLPSFKETKIYTQNIDTFNKAREFGSLGACLNMASDKKPGGGFWGGSRAQEESLCRRSNLILSIASFTEYGQKEFGSQFPKEDGRYPLRKFEGIYSPCVNVYRNSIYEYLQEPYITNVISVAALRHPRTDSKGLLVPEDAEIDKEKIRLILRIAIAGRHSKLVLGAFGCGAFGTPPAEMARLFKEVLEEPEFIHSFQEICFAVLDDHNSPRGGNYEPFKEVFGYV